MDRPERVVLAIGCVAAGPFLSYLLLPAVGSIGLSAVPLLPLVALGPTALGVFACVAILRGSKPRAPDQRQARAGPHRAGPHNGTVQWTERAPLQSPTGSTPGRPGKTMPEGTARGKTRGRLDRSVLVTLGKGLEDCFDEIRKQEVPERFKLLLQQF